jgi:hypothetical protein
MEEKKGKGFWRGFSVPLPLVRSIVFEVSTQPIYSNDMHCAVDRE